MKSGAKTGYDKRRNGVMMGISVNSSKARRYGIGAAAVHAVAAVVLAAVMIADVPVARALTNLPPAQMKFDVNRELHCLALNIYHEARGEPLTGQRAVGHVVMNRVSSGQFPDTICGVVQQGIANKLYRCQFTWWCDEFSDMPRDSGAWINSIALAYQVYVGHSKDPTGGALWYHADYVSPWWGRVLKANRKIGIHIFYVHNEKARAAWARPEGPNKITEAIQVSQLREALTLDPID